jgi:hypothetical protein
MNSVPHTLTKLEELIGMAERANTDFEKAAVFAASAPLIAFIEAEAEERFPHALENVERFRWHLAASVGYEIDNGHPALQHRSWARAAVVALRDSLVQ